METNVKGGRQISVTKIVLAFWMMVMIMTPSETQGVTVSGPADLRTLDVSGSPTELATTTPPVSTDHAVCTCVTAKNSLGKENTIQYPGGGRGGGGAAAIFFVATEIFIYVTLISGPSICFPRLPQCAVRHVYNYRTFLANRYYNYMFVPRNSYFKRLYSPLPPWKLNGSPVT